MVAWAFLNITEYARNYLLFRVLVRKFNLLKNDFSFGE
jgi:hypothetical protein